MHTTRDLANLLQLMQTSKQSGNLIVEPHVQSGTAWLGQLHLVNGQVMSCQVRGKADGRVLLRENEAMRWLMSSDRGKLQWLLEEPPPETFLPIMPTNEDARRDELSRMDRTNPSLPTQNNLDRRNTYRSGPDDARPAETYSGDSWQNIPPGAIPRRTELGNKAPGLVLSSRDLRQVFALVDGHRTVEEIVRLLHKSPDSVIRLLNELKAARLLE